MALVFIAGVFAAYPQNAWAQQVVGSVSQLSGAVQLVRTGITSGVTLSMPVQLHDQLSTGVCSFPSSESYVSLRRVSTTRLISLMVKLEGSSRYRSTIRSKKLRKADTSSLARLEILFVPSISSMLNPTCFMFCPTKKIEHCVWTSKMSSGEHTDRMYWNSRCAEPVNSCKDLSMGSESPA
jgi:hypothetical protein